MSTWSRLVLNRVQLTHVNIRTDAVYVDDLILITKPEDVMQKLKKDLATSFKMKDLGKLHYCLGVCIEQDEDQKCPCGYIRSSTF